MRGALSLLEAWSKYDAMESRLTACVSERMLDLARLGPGMSVLDLASGRGEPALRAASRVGPLGQVIGVDISDELLDLARREAAKERLSNVSFRATDAETLDRVVGDHARFDAALSRWGLMYMQRPLSVLMNVRASLRPHGPFVVALWAEPERVPWAMFTRRVLAHFCDLPRLDSNVPGAFRYADPSAIERDFGAAGFSIERIEELTVSVLECATGAGVVDWCIDLGFARPAEQLASAEQSAFLRSLLAAAEELQEGGMFRLGGVTRLVLARVS